VAVLVRDNHYHSNGNGARARCSAGTNGLCWTSGPPYPARTGNHTFLVGSTRVVAIDISGFICLS
jgi:hypothetical protein